MEYIDEFILMPGDLVSISNELGVILYKSFKYDQYSTWFKDTAIFLLKDNSIRDLLIMVKNKELIAIIEPGEGNIFPDGQLKIIKRFKQCI